MKRVIKFWSTYEDDSAKGHFSDCSTKYEITSLVVPDSFGIVELKKIAKEIGLVTVGSAHTAKPSEGYRSLRLDISQYIQLKEVREQKGMYSDKPPMKVYLGFISIPDIGLPIVKRVNSKMTKDQAWLIVNERRAGVDNVGTIDKTTYVIMEDWTYYHAIPLNGYSLEAFQKTVGATDRTFHDEVDSCSYCGEMDWQTDGGCKSHFRYVESAGLLGLNCGCFDEYAKANIGEYINQADQAIELDIAKDLEKDGKIVFVERFIGGMTDGRGGYFGGKATREGNPEAVLEELLKKKPNGKYVFSHDESGQFQTYFSVWAVKKSAKRKAA